MSPKHDSDDESRRISMSAIYRQLDDHLAADEEPYDVRAGLQRLVDWMGEEAPSEQATELLPEEVVFTGQSGTTWRYWTDQPLGTPGGFGGVYAAQGPAGESMAVKVVQKARPSGQLDNRLLRREVEIGRRVAESDGNLLLPVLDVAETDEALVMVMARADGTLADAALPMDDSAVISVLMDIASGLQQLHSIGIIHRNLKPANVLKHADRWKLADFWIARDQEIGTQNPTFVGWGSPPYMAPELWAGKSPTVKTDLYALGCVGFELLSGAPPYTGDNAAVREGHQARSIPGVSARNVTLRNLIMRLLAKDAGERPQDAQGVLERLQRPVMPRSPVQEAIARGLGSHAVERSHEAAERTGGGVIPGAVTTKACLDGHPYDLEDLAKLLPTGETRVVKEGDEYYLQSSRIDNPPENVPFYEVAQLVLQQVNGLARIMIEGFRPVRLTGRYTDGDQRHVVVSADVAEARAKAYAAAVVTGTAEPPPAAPPVGSAFLAVARSNNDVEEALDIMGRAERLNWGDLYKVYEVIEDAGTMSSVMNAAGVSKRRISLFTRTANHEKASGPDARHSRSKQDPPRNPMAIEDARRLISALFRSWVESFQLVR